MAKLTTKEKATSYETLLHVLKVQKALNRLAVSLIERGRVHDRSKLDTPEVEYFTKYTEELKDLTFGSKEYAESLEKMKPALQHHYANNRHHPEFHKHGVNDMNLIDVCEMVGDWWASSKRQHDGNIRLSLDEACKRFKVDPQLGAIIKNTLDLFDSEL
jgi:hypothetical protein